MPAPTGEIAKRSKLEGRTVSQPLGRGEMISKDLTGHGVHDYRENDRCSLTLSRRRNENPATEAGFRASNKRAVYYSAAASCVDALATSLIADIT